MSHFPGDFRDLFRAEIEAFVEALQRREYLIMGKMRIVKGAHLKAIIGHYAVRVSEQPLLFGGLLVQESARVGCSKRDLDRVRIDFLGEADGFFYGLLGFSGQADDKRAVDDNAELVAIGHEATCHIYMHALLDVEQNL